MINSNITKNAVDPNTIASLSTGLNSNIADMTHDSVNVTFVTEEEAGSEEISECFLAILKVKS